MILKFALANSPHSIRRAATPRPPTLLLSLRLALSLALGQAAPPICGPPLRHRFVSFSLHSRSRRRQWMTKYKLEAWIQSEMATPLASHIREASFFPFFFFFHFLFFLGSLSPSLFFLFLLPLSASNVPVGFSGVDGSINNHKNAETHFVGDMKRSYVRLFGRGSVSHLALTLAAASGLSLSPSFLSFLFFAGSPDN